MSGGELVGVDAAKGVAEEGGGGEFEVVEQRCNVAEVGFAGVGGSVAGVAVAALIESYDAVIGGQCRGEGGIGCSFHQVRVESYKCWARSASIEVGEGEAVVLKLVPLQRHSGALLTITLSMICGRLGRWKWLIGAWQDGLSTYGPWFTQGVLEWLWE